MSCTIYSSSNMLKLLTLGFALLKNSKVSLGGCGVYVYISIFLFQQGNFGSKVGGATQTSARTVPCLVLSSHYRPATNLINANHCFACIPYPLDHP